MNLSLLSRAKTAKVKRKVETITLNKTRMKMRSRRRIRREGTKAVNRKSLVKIRKPKMKSLQSLKSRLRKYPKSQKRNLKLITTIKKVKILSKRNRNKFKMKIIQMRKRNRTQMIRAKIPNRTIGKYLRRIRGNRKKPKRRRKVK